MRKIVTTLYKKLTSKDTWEKAVYFASPKDPIELKRKITKDDIIPIILSIIIYGGTVFVMMYFFKAIGSCIKR